ncbi:YncE family protein [Prauserella muralis]|uniref:Serine/threonine protein kinase n=1 Tax=Prauserella muralis TaxID=588067 RepID=A0A2V4B1C4_9PSEU|nr:beta-propeller fold lactonase family protein [Prauserella muralis]PXY26945.1 serine/threonine protein kinase [Prauserella muralis]TWE23442.1 YVTN family beta-propeller protein [Prauserella muralis]
MRTCLARLGALAATILLTTALAPAAHAAPPARDVMFVGNNWDGTVDLVDARTFEKYQRINVVPDLAERKAGMTPDQLVAMLVIRQTAGEGHDQLVDDIMVSPDGRTMYVSRPSLGDVSAFDVATGAQRWFTRVDGYRSDHMALSPNGRTLLVSATTANVVNVVDTATGEITGRIRSGDFPHENQFSADGSTIYNATIGNVVAPDAPLLDAAKGRRWLTIADAATLQVKKVIDFGVGIRPFVVMPDQRTMYAQLSFHNGFVEYDLAEERITRTVHLPLSEEAKRMKREDYPLDSAHHGLAMNADRSKICDAGTISDYAAILSVPALTVDEIVPTGKKPYWAATSPDGRHCFLSNSESDDISVVSYDNPREVARIPVGDHPQRVRGYTVPSDVLAS